MFAYSSYLKYLFKFIKLYVVVTFFINETNHSKIYDKILNFLNNMNSQIYKKNQQRQQCNLET
jgi:hypothetical protein